MAHAWDNASYPKRAQALVQSANIDANLAHFPALIVLTDTNAIAKADIASKRYQIYDYNGNEMPYEEDSYSEGASYANAKIWVGGSSTTLYASPTGDQNKFWIYYGDYDPGSDQDDPTNVWHATYKGVYHCNDASGGLADSTSNSNDLSTVGGTPFYQATGQLGDDSGITFSKTSREYCETSSGIVSDPFTITAVAKATDDTDDNNIACLADASAADQYWRLVWDGGAAGDPIEQVSYDGGLSMTATTTGFGTATFHHGASVFKTGAQEVWIDGGSKGSNSDSVSPSNIDTTSVGRVADSTPRYSDATVDEVRFYDDVLSDEWVKFEYHNIFEADHEQTWSAEEDKPSTGIVILRRRREAA